MKVRSTDELSYAVQDDLAWRRKELIALRGLVRRAKGLDQQTAIRAGIAVLYAHWEGFVKHAADAYLEFVVSQARRQRLTWDELDRCFLALGLRAHAPQLGEAHSAGVYRGAVDFVLDRGPGRANVPTRGVVRTRANLKYGVLREILDGLGLDTAAYELKEKLIDYRLVDARNNVAHGHYLAVDADDFQDLRSQVDELIDTFGKQVVDAARDQAYLAAPTP